MIVKTPALVSASAPMEQLVAPKVAACSRRWRSAELFGNAQQVEIVHGQAVYRLRLTTLGKLILTK